MLLLLAVLVVVSLELWHFLVPDLLPRAFGRPVLAVETQALLDPALDVEGLDSVFEALPLEILALVGQEQDEVECWSVALRPVSV